MTIEFATLNFATGQTVDCRVIRLPRHELAFEAPNGTLLKVIGMGVFYHGNNKFLADLDERFHSYDDEMEFWTRTEH